MNKKYSLSTSDKISLLRQELIRFLEIFRIKETLSIIIQQSKMLNSRAWLYNKLSSNIITAATSKKSLALLKVIRKSQHYKFNKLETKSNKLFKSQNHNIKKITCLKKLITIKTRTFKNKSFYIIVQICINLSSGKFPIHTKQLRDKWLHKKL